MKRITKIILTGLISIGWLGSIINPVLAGEGENGFFGGISEGDYLPKTIEKYVAKKINKTNTYTYKEVVFYTGRPIELTGTIQTTIDLVDFQDKPSGKYKESYVIEASNSDQTVKLNRVLNLETAYYTKNGEYKRQVIKNSYLTAWQENVVTPAGNYSLKEGSGIFSKATVEDITPGVTYYNTTLSYSGVLVDDNKKEMLISMAGDIYGYRQPWSKVESQKLNLSLSSEKVNINVYLKPKLEAKKTIYYNQNEPFPISFGGTYNQRMEREGTLYYKIQTFVPDLSKSEVEKSIILTTPNEIEKLPIPEGLDFIEGHWAQEPLKKLYSMEVLTGLPRQGMQFESMTRGDFVKALCLAMDIDTTKYEQVKKDAPVIFGDVKPGHPMYPYIMGAYDAKLVVGTGENFDVNLPISRQEAFVIYIRVIGLERLGITNSPTTAFVDDAQISKWAKKEIAAGVKLGIIQGNAEGKVNPLQWINKAEAAAIIDRLIEYLRRDIGKDY